MEPVKLLEKCDTLPQSATHAVRQVKPTVWQVTSFFPVPTNCWIIQGRDGLSLIDAAHPWSGDFILSAIKALNQPLRRIIITHAHPDHFGAAREIAEKTDAVVYAHVDDVKYVEGRKLMSDERGFWQCRMLLGTAQKLGVTAPLIEGVQSLEDGEEIANLRVIHTPGHTPGSLSLWAEKEEAIVTGDNLLYRLGSVRIGIGLFTLDSSVQKAGLHRYLELPARMLLPGHGPAISGDVRRAIRRLLL